MKIAFDLVNPLKGLLGCQGSADHILRKADIEKSKRVVVDWLGGDKIQEPGPLAEIDEKTHQ